MDAALLLRVLSLCVVLAGAETLHGIARTVWVVPRIGKERALKLSAVTGSLLAFGICLLLVPPMGLSGYGAHAVLGCAALAGYGGDTVQPAFWRTACKAPCPANASSSPRPMNSWARCSARCLPSRAPRLCAARRR